MQGEWRRGVGVSSRSKTSDLVKDRQPCRTEMFQEHPVTGWEADTKSCLGGGNVRLSNRPSVPGDCASQSVQNVRFVPRHGSVAEGPPQTPLAFESRGIGRVMRDETNIVTSPTPTSAAIPTTASIVSVWVIKASISALGMPT